MQVRRTPHILMVEDNQGDVRFVKMMLSQPDVNQYQLTNVSSLADAIRHLSQDEYDVILLDLDLPDSQGIETLSQMKSQASNIPIVVMTDSCGEAFALQVVQAGAQDYLFKGKIDEQQLSRALSYSIERKRLEFEIRHMAHHDQLTGLANRSLFRERLQRTIIRAERQKEIFAVLYLDLDHFKSVNDGLGHEMGDQLLVSVAERLTDVVRKSDTVGRLGGDEFAIILDTIKTNRCATTVANKINTALSQAFELSDHTLYTGSSIGIAVYPHSGTTVGELLRNSDNAMYRAKQNGRGQCQYHTEDMDIRALEQLQMEIELHKALENEEFILHYQPKINLETGKVTGMEALLRWQHPRHGLIFPEAFISLLEESGMIVEVGNWVMNQACEQRKRWQQDGMSTGAVAVNLSGRQLMQRDLGDSVKSILSRTGLEPTLLEVELTESLLINNTSTCSDTIDSLRTLGVSIAVDDFGTGYSSLSYLKQFMFDTIKIDRSFISNITKDTTDAAITSAVIRLSRDLDINVVAEGVENRQQLDYLRKQKTKEIQGYYISPPMPAESFTNLFHKQSKGGNNYQYFAA